MKRALTIFLVVLLSGCATYYQRSIKFHQEIAKNDFGKAIKLLEDDKRIQRDRNRFLFLVNMGFLHHLQQEFEASNKYFNEADLMAEDAKKNLASEGLALISNPEVRPYTPEDFEPVMIHYYKALNYLNLGKYDASLVEARRMNLTLNRLNDRYKDHKNRYQADAFAHIIMGIAYEASGELNDAFIAYRNAYNVYEGEHGFFGIKAPEQLKEDLLRTSYLLGFTNDFLRYKEEFKREQYEPQALEAGELVFFWHNGMGPIKDEWSINFFVVPGQAGYVVFENEELGLSFPFYVGDDKQKKNDLMALKVVRVAFPKYLERPVYYQNAMLDVNGKEYKLEKVEDINAIAFKTLQDRFLREMSASLLRLAVKKAAEISLAEQNEALGVLATVTNAVTEKADTRHWQTLPHSIHYSRVPLKKDQNNVVLHLVSQKGRRYTQSFTFNGEKGKRYFFPYHNIEHLAAASWDKPVLPKHE